jgi:hypothetical protein
MTKRVQKWNYDINGGAENLANEKNPRTPMYNKEWINRIRDDGQTPESQVNLSVNHRRQKPLK